MNNYSHVKEFFKTVEGRKFIKEMNDILKDLKWMEESFEIGMGRWVRNKDYMILKLN